MKERIKKCRILTRSCRFFRLFSLLVCLLSLFCTTRSVFALDVVNVRPNVTDSLTFHFKTGSPSVIWNLATVRIGSPLPATSGGLTNFNRVSDLQYFAGSNFSVKKGSVATFSLTSTTYAGYEQFGRFNTGDDFDHPLRGAMDVSFDCPIATSKFAVKSCQVDNSISYFSDLDYSPIYNTQSPSPTLNYGTAITSTMSLVLEATEDFSGVELDFAGQWFHWYLGISDVQWNKPTIVSFFTSPTFAWTYEESVQQSVNAASEKAHDDATAQLQATNQQTEQQKEQYEQEKEEENRREEESNEQAGSLAGIFNITLMNPLAGIWELFNPGGCTSIPTISSWLGSKDKTYCSWWPQNIRAVLTPVFSIASVIVLFGFVVRWLGGGNDIDIKGVKL